MFVLADETARISAATRPNRVAAMSPSESANNANNFSSNELLLSRTPTKLPLPSKPTVSFAPISRSNEFNVIAPPKQHETSAKPFPIKNYSISAASAQMPSDSQKNVFNVPSSKKQKVEFENSKNTAAYGNSARGTAAVRGSTAAAAKTAVTTKNSNSKNTQLSRSQPIFVAPIAANSSNVFNEAELSVLKARIDELEEKNAISLNSSVKIVEMEHSQQLLQERITSLKSQNELLQKELHEIQQKSAEFDSTHRHEQQRLIERYTEECATLTHQIQQLKSTKSSVERTLEESQLDLAATRSRLAECTSQKLALENELLSCKQSLSSLQTNLMQEKTTIVSLSETLRDLRCSNSQLEANLREAETLRRVLFNQVQELKGNIRVFCRIRPALASENGTLCQMNVSDDGSSIEIVQKTESAAGATQTKSNVFSFDRIFTQSITQEGVFNEVSQLIQSSLDGYKVCIFAYGQTGSGKTFTMEGVPSADPSQNIGIIPRSVYKIFESIAALEPLGWRYTLEASFLEIYNETIRDLLVSGSAVANAASYEIRHVGGKTSVSDLTVACVDSPQAIINLLVTASRNRSVAETLCNERSSRSHSVFTLQIRGENASTNERCEGQLNLVDLAGSERLSQSGATGDRLKETQCINRSLSSLGDVIAAIAARDAHVPYRNSKLTYLLQNALGGNCKTLMFVNVSPLAANQQESVCSLRFAAKVNSCQVGTARRSVK